MADYIVSEEVLRQVLDILEARLTKENRWTAGECDTMDNLRTILSSPPAEPVVMDKETYTLQIKEAWESGFRSGLKEVRIEDQRA